MEPLGKKNNHQPHLRNESNKPNFSANLDNWIRKKYVQQEQNWIHWRRHYGPGYGAEPTGIWS